ncbi:putative ubiquitin conjugating enzyme [Mariannaea sp. PMI_226]|nr:putative ubiquitin conjugating enzyme [Mariannaea sp. PMI_226]
MITGLVARGFDYAKQASADPDSKLGGRNFYGWAWSIFLVDFIIFIPVLILVSYTFQKVLPVFAIVEDERPPAYEPVRLDDESLEASSAVPGVPVPAAGAPKPASAAVPTRPLNLDGTHPVTHDFMATWRLLRSHGGFRSIFRGFSCYIFQVFVQSWIGALLRGPFFIFASLAASLLLVQFSTAWVHIVMTPPSAQHFWRRLPPFKHTLNATWRPVTLLWVLTMAAAGITYVLIMAMGLKHEKSGNWDVPSSAEGVKYLIVACVSIFLQVFLVVPAYVTLVRVQASLLPDDQETIIPFDRSFQGKVEPAVIGGTGFITLRDAWATFSKAAWRRLIIFYVKIIGIGMAVNIIIGAILVPQFFLLSYKTKAEGQ